MNLRPGKGTEIYRKDFELTRHEEFFLHVPFTRETWHGRMKTCRGIGASLTASKTE